MPPVTEPRQTSRKRREDRASAILDATIELLAEVGYDRMTMDTVASRATASKATIYRHWPDKPTLVLYALRRRGAMVPSLADTGSLRGDLELYVRESATATAGTAGSLIVGLLGVASRDPDFAALLAQQFHSEQLPTITTLIERARDRNELSRHASLRLISETLPGTLIMHMLVLGLPADEPFIDHLVDEVLLPLLTGDRHRPLKTKRPAGRVG